MSYFARMCLLYVACVCSVVLGFFLINYIDETEPKTGVVFGKTEDVVQVGKSGQERRFRVALKYPDSSTTTMSIAFDKYLTTQNGMTVTHEVRKHERMGLVAMIAVILISVGGVLGAVSLYEVFTNLPKTKPHNNFTTERNL